MYDRWSAKKLSIVMTSNLVPKQILDDSMRAQHSSREPTCSDVRASRCAWLAPIVVQALPVMGGAHEHKRKDIKASSGRQRDAQEPGHTLNSLTPTQAHCPQRKHLISSLRVMVEAQL